MPNKRASLMLSRRSSLALGTASLLAPRAFAGAPPALRVGHFPNVTHVQALVARGFSRQGKGWFEQRLGRPIEWFVYNAGPSAMEAIFAGSIDLTYVGPSPAINAYVKSRGEEIRIVAGAADGGSALVVQPQAGLRTQGDFRGKTLATPQLGNTQDVSARRWLAAGGLRVTLAGGDVRIVPTENPDQLALFKTHQLDAVWTVEPWVSRLEAEAGGVVLIDERDAVTTVLVARRAVLDQERELVRHFVAAHEELTDWIVAHPKEAREIVRAELSAEVHAEVSPALVERSWGRIVLTKTVAPAALETFVAGAREAGFLRAVPDLGRLIETP